MPEPVDPAADFRRTRARSLREVQYREFDPAEDAHGDAEECVGVRGPKRFAEEGGRTVTRAEWTLTGTAARPVLRSLIVDGSESWVIESLVSEPVAGSVFVIACVLGVP